MVYLQDNSVKSDVDQNFRPLSVPNQSVFSWEDTCPFTSYWWNVYRFSFWQSRHPSFCENTGSLASSNIDNLTISDWMHFISHTFETSAFWTAVIWLGSVSGITSPESGNNLGYQISIRLLWTIDGRPCHREQTTQAPSAFHCSSVRLFGVFNSNTETSHTCVNIDDVSTSTRRLIMW